MGYSTSFKGELRFTSEPTAKQLAALKAICGEDCRDHPEWEGSEGLYYVDLELTDDFSGIRWNGAEKTYGLERIVNVVLAEMRKQWPDFGLTGSLLAQGESLEDRWALHMGADLPRRQYSLPQSKKPRRESMGRNAPLHRRLQLSGGVMSHYLSQLEGSERAQECIRNDKEMADNLHPLFKLALAPFAPPVFSEAELLEADRLYLENQAQRDRQRIALLHEMELNRLREVGGI
jgi:hypothetical protein